MHYQPIILEIKKYLNTNELLEHIKTFADLKDLNINEVLIVEKKEGKSSIGVEDTAKVVEWNYYKSDKLRVCLILDAEKLTTEAQNSLLKVLEESSNNALIILQTVNSDSLLQTIRSRCKVVSISSEKEQENAEIKEFFEKSFLERDKEIEKILKSENSREEINKMLTGLIKYLIENIDKFEKKSVIFLDVIELLRFCSIANKSSVNTRLLLDNVNINLELLSANK